MRFKERLAQLKAEKNGEPIPIPAPKVIAPKPTKPKKPPQQVPKKKPKGPRMQFIQPRLPHGARFDMCWQPKEGEEGVWFGWLEIPLENSDGFERFVDDAPTLFTLCAKLDYRFRQWFKKNNPPVPIEEPIV